MLMRKVVASGLALLMIQPALAQVQPCGAPADAVNASDEERLAGIVKSRTRGLAAALLADRAADRVTISALYTPGFTPTSSLPDGDYQCRTIKLGGMLPAVVYDYFSCRIGEEGSSIAKTSGSQRFSGSLTPSNGGFFYRGALHFGDEQPVLYGSDGERNQVGCLYQLAGEDQRYLLELPSPMFESLHDVVELVARER